MGTASSYSGIAATVTLPKPSGAAAGDVLVASFTADQNPSISSVPTGWTPIVNGLRVWSGAEVFAYYHVVGTADGTSYSWTTNPAVKWGGGITAYRGVNTTTPLDATVATQVSSGTSITVPGITTASSGAMLIGGAGYDSGTPAITPPTGWSERWEAAGGQITEEADRLQSSAGASGTSTWTFSASKAAGAWQTALKPAS